LVTIQDKYIIFAKENNENDSEGNVEEKTSIGDKSGIPKQHSPNKRNGHQNKNITAMNN